jgi:hypothetical protein
VTRPADIIQGVGAARMRPPSAAPLSHGIEAAAIQAPRTRLRRVKPCALNCEA